jgi:hypothetical protein
MQSKRPIKSDIEIKVIEDREMTDQEVETIAQILFEWWRREFESKEIHEKTPKEERGT